MISFSIQELYTIMLASTRFSALLMVVPPFAGESMPRLVRVSLALILTYLLLPVIAPTSNIPTHWLHLILEMTGEIFTGLLMGMSIILIFGAIEFAGHVISQEIGLVRSESLNPLTGTSGGSVGVMLYYFGGLILLITGLHYEVLYALARSFELIPVGHFSLRTLSLEALLRDSVYMWEIGVKMAAPFIAVNFIVLMTFAILGKIAPKVNVFMVSFAVRIAIGTLVLAGTIGLLGNYISSYMQDAPQTMLEYIM